MNEFETLVMVKIPKFVLKGLIAVALLGVLIAGAWWHLGTAAMAYVLLSAISE